MVVGYYFDDLASLTWSKWVMLGIEKKESGLRVLSWGADVDGEQAAKARTF